MKFPSPEFEAALAALCDGFVDDTSGRELVRTDAAARDAYLFAVELHARLATDNALFAPLPHENKSVVEPNLVSFSRRPLPVWLKLAAAVALAGAATAFYFLRPLADDRAVFARFVKSAGAEFSNGLTVQEGGALHGETLTLTQGSVELATGRGATVVLEAPAEFRFESAQRLHLARGKAAADVPPAAKGFTILTPSGELVDLGTKFGVDVPKSGATELHVFQGEVVARADGTKERHRVKDDQALTLAAGIAASQELRSAAFIHAPELQQLAAGVHAGRPARGVASSEALRNDPAWLAGLDFPALPGGDFRWVQGRWPGSRAAEFVAPGDHLIFDTQGTTEALTMMAWVRLDRLPRAINSLYHADDWGVRGKVHWMVLEGQRMRFAVFGLKSAADNTPYTQHPESIRPVSAETGCWTHLAVVYDARRAVVRFFADGRFDNEVRLEAAVPAVLGPARVGNWNHQERILSGRLDELVMLRRALSDEEVRASYEAGNPYP